MHLRSFLLCLCFSSIHCGEDEDFFYSVPYAKERPAGTMEPKYNVLFISESIELKALSILCNVGYLVRYRTSIFLFLVRYFSVSTNHKFNLPKE